MNEQIRFYMLLVLGMAAMLLVITDALVWLAVRAR